MTTPQYAKDWSLRIWDHTGDWAETDLTPYLEDQEVYDELPVGASLRVLVLEDEILQMIEEGADRDIYGVPERSSGGIEVRWEVRDLEGDVIASGTHDIVWEATEPPCVGDLAHDWTSEGMGGLDENPGVWGIGGTAIRTVQECRHCSLICRKISYGSQRNPGQYDQVSYESFEIG